MTGERMPFSGTARTHRRRRELMVALKSRFTLKNPTGWKSQEGGP